MTASAFMPWAARSFGRPIFAPAFTRKQMSAGHLPQSSPSSRFTARRGRSRGCEPIGRSPAATRWRLALRDRRCEPHLAGMGERGRAVGCQMFVEAQAKACFGQHTWERGLTVFKRIAAEVVAV